MEKEKGKEYYDKDLKFKGEYLNGKRHGKVKEYYDDKHLKFEGEYLKNIFFFVIIFIRFILNLII